MPFIADQMGIFVKFSSRNLFSWFVDDKTTEFVGALLNKEPSTRAKGADLYEFEWLSGIEKRLPLPRSSVDSGLGDVDDLEY